MNFWAEYKEVNGLQSTCNNIVQADEKPSGNWWGPYHCRGCADNCANFGMTEQQAFAFNHGTADEAFGALLVVQ